MSIQIAEISKRLQSALDQSYNVADMDTVLQVISTLENIQITKEQLETTRLGKYINHLRRKTANESLARRAKNLLKKWREMVLPSAGANQPQTYSSTQQNVMPPIARDSQHDGRGVQLKEPAQFHDVTSTSMDNSKYPSSSDSRRFGRSHDTGSNHTPGSIQKITEMAADPDGMRYNKLHDSKKSNLSTNFGRSPSSSSLSGSKSKDTDLYRTMSTINDNSKSHVSISALPKIPKIKNPATTQRLSKHTDRSHSPLMNLRESSSPKFSSIAHDDNSMHAYDMQNYKRFPSNQLPMLNGRNQDYSENNTTAIDNNSNSSSINIIAAAAAADMNVPNVSQPSSEILNSSEVVKKESKKHKKHKKDKKSKKQKQSSPSLDRTSSMAGPPILELPDSLSSNSMSLFATTSDSIKDQHMSTNNNAFANIIGTSLPSTSVNVVASAGTSKSTGPWTTAPKSSTVPTDDLTFTGKFTKNDDNIIINIDSSSGSNSPKYPRRSPMLITATSRSSSPRINLLPMRTAEFGSRVATDEDNSSTQHISLIQQTDSLLTSPFEESIVQDDLLASDPTKGAHAQSNVATNALETQQTGKKRGRKKGSKGVDSRLGSASNSSQSQQTGAPYYDSISFSSLKNKIDLIRGTTKKVKTTKELLAELQNRKATTSGDDVTSPNAQFQIYSDDDENAATNGKLNSGSRTVTPRSERSTRKSKSAPKEELVSDNQNALENQAVAVTTEPKSIVDQEINELREKLPPMNKTLLRAWKKSYLHDDIVCTCKLIEVADTNSVNDGVQPKEENFDAIDNSVTTNPNLGNAIVPKTLTDSNILPQVTPCKQHHSQLSDDQSTFTKPIPRADGSKVTNSTGTSLATDNQTTTTTTTNERSSELMDPPAKKPTVKSIFDLDYEDDDDDPITFKLNHNNNINFNTKVKLSSSRDSNNDISDDKSCDEFFLNENINRHDDDDDDNAHVKEGKATTVNRSVPFNDNSMAIKTELSNNTNQLSDDHNDPMDEKCTDVNRKVCDDITQSIVIDANVMDTSVADQVNVNVTKSLHDDTKSSARNAIVDLNQMANEQRFRIEDDPNCKAKQLYITSKQSITEFHIDKLHTSYIPNINGNWDDAKDEDVSIATALTTTTTTTTTETATTTIDGHVEKSPQIQCDDVKQDSTLNIDGSDEMTECKMQLQPSKESDETVEDCENEPRITEASIGLYEHVVPRCNHLFMDRLPKNLHHINLDFGSTDEVEPHIFLASIQVKKEIITTDDQTEPTQTSLHDECKAISDDSHHSDANDENGLVTDGTFVPRIHEDFPIYDCDNDIEYERKHSPELGFTDMHQEYETIETAFDCGAVEQLEMEVDEIPINNSEIKSDNELMMCPMANDDFIEPKQFDDESDVELFTGNEPGKLSPVIDENARADADDVEPLHQVIDLNPNQILPAADENAMDSMDFENQLSKSFDIAMINEQDECKSDRDRFDGSKLNKTTDADLEAVDSIATDLSESGDENIEPNDDSSLEEDLSFDNYEQEDTSNDHFITLDNFDAALVPSSSEFKQSPSNNSGSSCDEEPNNDTALEGKLFGSMVCDDDDDNEMSDSDDIDDDSDTINNLVVPTMFCKPVFIEGGKSTNLLNDNSDSQSAGNSDDLSEVKPLEAESSDSNPENDANLVNTLNENADLQKATSITDSNEPTVKKLTIDALETHQALSSIDDCKQQKRFRSTSSSSISSTTSSTSSSSTLSQSKNRSKKMKRWMRRRPCPQHYRCASSTSQSSSHSQMSVLSPSSMFTNAIEPSEPVVRMDVTESSPVKDFIPVPDSHRRNDREFDQISKTITNASPEHQQMNQNASQKDQAEKIDTVIESNTTPPSPNTVNDELIAGNESLTRDRDNDLLYQQLLLPDKLLQSDEKDGDDDSNSAGGTQQNQNSIKLADGEDLQDQNMKHESSLSSENNGMLPSFNNLGVENVNGFSVNGYKFKEWYEVVHVKSYNDELLTILPYVVID